MRDVYPARRIFVRHVDGSVAGYPRMKSVKVEVDAHMSYLFGNNSPYFAISTTTYNNFGRGMSYGCQHELAIKVFPKIKPFVKWHLTGLDGPSHYVANAVFFWKQWRHETKYLADRYDPYEAFQHLTHWGLDSTETDGQLKYLFTSPNVTEADMKTILNQRFHLMMDFFHRDMEKLFGTKIWINDVISLDAEWREVKRKKELRGSNHDYFRGDREIARSKR